MATKPDMLTADELEALRMHARETSKLARAAFGGAPASAEELEAKQRSDEWWAKRLAQIREREVVRHL